MVLACLEAENVDVIWFSRRAVLALYDAIYKKDETYFNPSRTGCVCCRRICGNSGKPGVVVVTSGPERQI